ncbi:MAG: TldD/PmbA family protein [Candidatus Methylarchaceae archaeon HK01B]|nr:TldD/PmbA family protein [Candidatus Methylarchaceae archaeon HK01B]
MDEDLLRSTVDLAQKLGAEYAEARLHKIKTTGCLLRNGVPEPAMIGDAYGIGIRVICSGSLAFSATNDLSWDNVKVILEKAVKRAKASSSLLEYKILLSEERAINEDWRAEEKKSIENVGFEDLFEMLKNIEYQIKDGKAGVAFPNRLLVSTTLLEEKMYMNSNGARITSRVPRLGFYSYVTTSYRGKTVTITIPSGYSQLGESGGWEVVDRLKIYEYVQKEAENLALVVKNDQKPPKETVDVVLGPDVSGIIAHESSGHPGEADRILGREAAQAGESYLKSDDIGLKIGSEEAYVSDDPTILHSNGFYLYDDEGVPARKRILIEAGVIREFLHNRSTAYEFGVSSNGASRSMSYDREPIIRMANTYIEPGDYSLEELLEDIKSGVYIKSFMEWNIDDQRFNQRYVGLEAYMIEKGEIKGMVRNPILEITTPKLWSSVDARGKEVEFVAATCGKGDPMQSAPVWTGGPDMRLRAIRLGAR